MAKVRVLDKNLNPRGWNVGDEVEVSGERLTELLNNKQIEVVEYTKEELEELKPKKEEVKVKKEIKVVNKK